MSDCNKPRYKISGELWLTKADDKPHEKIPELDRRTVECERCGYIHIVDINKFKPEDYMK